MGFSQPTDITGGPHPVGYVIKYLELSQFGVTFRKTVGLDSWLSEILPWTARRNPELPKSDHIYYILYLVSQKSTKEQGPYMVTSSIEKYLQYHSPEPSYFLWVWVKAIKFQYLMVGYIGNLIPS